MYLKKITGQASAQIEADRRLLDFSCYEDYLDSLTNINDDCYLLDLESSRAIAELGFRCAGETLSRQQFDKRVAAVLLYLYPPYKPYESASEGFRDGDELQMNLALRERVNRVGILSTIIFVRYYTHSGCEISGYMDFSEKLITEDWKPFFKGQKKIIPKHTDLGYYHWKTGSVVSNDSLNYKVVMDPNQGLLFRNRYDRKLINPAPGADAGHNTKRKRVHSTMYDSAIIFDHVVRQRI